MISVQDILTHVQLVDQVYTLVSTTDSPTSTNCSALSSHPVSLLFDYARTALVCILINVNWMPALTFMLASIA